MTKILIIGAGIVGLSIAYEFSKKKRNFKIFVLEKNKKFGSGNSSQSSEVIHSGVYYKKNSLKNVLCIFFRVVSRAVRDGFEVSR